MKAISIGLLGLGTVGSGVVQIIESHQDKLMHQVGCSISIKKILVKDTTKERLVAVEKGMLTDNPEDILSNPEIDVVIEVMGGIEETRGYLIEAIKNKSISLRPTKT